MDWFVEHLKFVVFAVSALAYWINQRRAARRQGQQPQSTAKKIAQPPGKLDDDERVRRVQEEIRRRIMERSGAGPVVVNQSLQTPPSELRRLPPRLPKPVESPSAEAAAKQRAEILERQMKMAETFRLLEAKRAQVERATDNVVESGRLRSEAGWLAAETKLMAELRDPASLRRAIIMREVLGPPVGLR